MTNTGTPTHTQYPYEQHEQNRYYSGYDNVVHQLEQGGESYTGYSIWVRVFYLPVCFAVYIQFLSKRSKDTFRAEWAWQILFVPERIPGMVQSMLADYQQASHLHTYIPTYILKKSKRLSSFPFLYFFRVVGYR